MKILVTGGFGFLGSHLVETILAHDPEAEITVLDDLSSNVVNPKLFMADKPTVRFIESTVRVFYGADKPYDQIYHLASPVGPAGVLPVAGRIAKIIVGDTHHLANMAQRYKSKFLFVSTSEVYGGGRDGYCSEEMDLIVKANEPSARLEYATGKLAAEVMLLNYRDLDSVIVRPFNIAGARQSGKGGFVLPRFLKAAQDGKPLTVFKPGSQTRALTDVRDVAEGLYLAMKNGKTGEIYNIGNPLNKCTIKELAKKVLALYDTKSYLEYFDPKEIFGRYYVEANDKYPSSAKANKELGWEPKYDLDDIIKSAIDERRSK